MHASLIKKALLIKLIGILTFKKANTWKNPILYVPDSARTLSVAVDCNPSSSRYPPIEVKRIQRRVVETHGDLEKTDKHKFS